MFGITNTRNAVTLHLKLPFLGNTWEENKPAAQAAGADPSR